MTSHLLLTKLNIPSHPARLVERPHLLSHLNQGLEGKLVLVSAPAGYGKTTLVASLLSRQRDSICTAWLSLDESDNDPVRFLSYLLAALQQAQPGLGEALMPVLKSQQPPPGEVVLTALLNELTTVPRRFIVVLDDYHAIEMRQIHQLVAFLIDHQPESLHLVVITRTDPLLPVARWRGRGQVLEIRQEDLRFSAQECASFLNELMGLGLSAEDVAALERRTEGWIAGLQLAALSMRGRDDLPGFVRAFTGSSRFILDYLMGEVFERQPEKVRDFLLKTSILERLSAPLCNAVVGIAESQELLEILEHANLFIVPLDQSRLWYRYHRLFAELLRSRLRVSQIPEGELHARASLWFDDNGFPAEAVQEALAGEDWQRAVALLQRITPQMLKQGEAASVARWYAALPREMVLADPQLCFEHSWPLLLVGEYRQAELLLDRAERGGAAAPEFLGEVCSAQAYHARVVGDHPRMVERSRRALELLPEGALHSRSLVSINLGLAYWHMGRMADAEPVLAEALQAGRATSNHYAALTALIFQGRVFAVRGQLHQAAELARTAIQQGSEIPINALAHLDLSVLHYEWNELSESEQHLGQALTLSQRAQNHEFAMACWMMLSTLRLAQADLDGAGSALENAWALVRSGKVPELNASRLPAAQVRFILAKGDRLEAATWLDRLSPQVDAHNFYRFLGLTRALLLPPDQDRRYLQGLAQAAQGNGWIYGLICTRIEQALRAENEQQAQSFLEEALQLGQSGGFLRSFIDAGAALAPLLQAAIRQGVCGDYAGRILAAMPLAEAAPPASQQPLVEALSERELEVLRLVAAGMSNREIASALVITPGTAKTHIHNLCGKLGVRNRTEAAMKARQLGII